MRENSDASDIQESEFTISFPVGPYTATCTATDLTELFVLLDSELVDSDPYTRRELIRIFHQICGIKEEQSA